MSKHNNISGNGVAISTIGLDLSDKTAAFCILDQAGAVAGSGFLRLTREELHKHFGQLPPVRIALEACGQSGWVEEVLTACGHEVIVANAREVRSISGNPRKCDARDAEQLARLARVDPELLKPVRHQRNAGRRLDMVVIRSRALLVESRTRLVNGARGMAKQFGEHIPSCTTANFGERAQKALPPALGAALRVLVKQIEALSEAIAVCDQQVEALAAKMADSRWLKSVPGVGSLTAVTFLLTLDDPQRFAHSRDVGPYLGMVPARGQSGEHDPELGISKAGNRYLRKLLVQCAHHILGRYGADSALRQWGLEKAAGSRKAKKRAIVAVARKLAVLLHRLWTKRELYKPFPANAANARHSAA